ncbi:unnamed protein product [Candida verbasci]|uniref:Homing endonuclease LAGLIDADG domain-containing protein n=1 Tax=Candida verbasci TaxID=1227364 RepID=A0A9W4TZW2_9ASCO|nr:unnamed protein product [Candida verbasci]
MVRIGNTVSPIPNKKALKYVISHSDGLLRVLVLINGKLKTYSKYYQIINNLFVNNKLVETKFYAKYDQFIMDSNGSLQIKFIERKGNPSKYEVRLKLQIPQKDREILDYIKLFVCNTKDINDINNSKGCYIGSCNHKNGNYTYYLETTSFARTKKIILYLDNYQLISYKYINYL